MAELILTIPDGMTERLDKALAELVPAEAALSRSRIAKLIGDGAVSGVDGVVGQPKHKVAAGETYRISLPEPEPVETLPQDIPLNVVFEDDALIVIDKPAGMVVHPAPGSPNGTLVNALLHHCAGSLSGIGGEMRPGIVHRIDKETSGLLVAAKSDLAHHALAAQFEAHSADRAYLALAHGHMDAADARLRGTRGVSFEPGSVLKVSSRLDRHPTDRQKQAVYFEGERGRHAVTRVRMLESFGSPPAAMLVECRLETGRTHQIRVHMAHAGLGLIGDPVYGGSRKASAKSLGAAAVAVQAFPRQALHAARLGFRHPVTGEQLEFTSPLPADMQDLLTSLRGTGGSQSR
ncbi:RluA family pseudouridine synthase [Paracoccus albus]|uniref:RluA family pseudouridine synthase n=1 Tax=Paracoccus albus TaxID=3017784 RepID=UPI0022F05B45|nr:RluA family pseudouridine synthase [Paracoccus albus]WBU59405.1 RluA family pseudouridine synthase [Paracoccus albus]